ncbi:MAG: hypothetical protein ABI193_05710 [Minicystis sp.]
MIELVSNREGDELGGKRRRYAKMAVAYYVVWDPSKLLGETTLRAFELRGDLYVSMGRIWFENVKLGLVVWEGVFEGRHDRWLRWCREDGSLVLTGAERADEEKARADEAQTRADEAQTRADEAQTRAERLAARLRALGVDPDE